MALNREWHEKNKMPPKATLAQRISWHVEHAKHCDCRPMPEGIAEAIETAKRKRPRD